MSLFKITGCVAALALALPSTNAGAAADQKNNRGYVVGKGGVARAANNSTTEGAQDNVEPHKQSQGPTLGESLNPGAPPSPAGNGTPQAVAGGNCQAPGPDHKEPAPDSLAQQTALRHDAAKSCIGNAR